MSGLLMGQVWELALSKGQQTVLLALADHAHDDGSHVFPSIGRIAWKTGYQRRHVQRTMRELQQLKVLIEVAPATRRLPTEYRVAIAAGKRKEPFVTRGDISDTQGRPDGASGASPRPPEPPVEPSVETTPSSSPTQNGSVSDEFAEWLNHYRETTGNNQVRGSASARRAFAARRAEGRSLADLKLATTGCHGNDFLRRNGHDVPDTILRASKIERYIRFGRDDRAEAEDVDTRAIRQFREQGLHDEADEMERGE